MSKMDGISQEEFVKQWFMNNPDRDISHLESKPAIEAAWLRETGSRLEDSDRAIRKLAAQGELIKVEKGVYRYDTVGIYAKDDRVFSDFTKTAVLERDGFKCRICGAETDYYNDLHVVPMQSFDLGGSNALSNGKTVCSFHFLVSSFLDKNEQLSKTALRDFLDNLKLAGKLELKDNEAFLEDFLHLVEKHGISLGVRWKEIV